MAHQLSIQSGRAEMFSGNSVVPWHKLGTVVAGLLKAADAIKAAHLDWQVKAMPVTVNGIVLPFPTEESSADCFQGIVRADTGATLGIMKGRYEIIQNAECFDFMDTLAGEGKLRYETAGAMRDGKHVWMMAKYDGEITLNGDSHEQWLLLVSSHDGSLPLMVQWVTVRVVCANTLSIALACCKNQVKIRHTSNWEDKAAEARRVLGLTENYFAEMQTALAGLNEQPLKPEDMDAFTRLLIPAKDESEVPTKTRNTRDEIMKRFCVPDAGTFGGSRWDALNAVTDYVDHGSKLRAGTSRLESSLLGTGSDLKQKAFDLLTGEDLMKQLIQKQSDPAFKVNTTATGTADFQRLLGN